MKFETQALIEKARQSLQAADHLRQEGFLDFAASRAYYAMFYTAEALLIERSLSYNSHSAVIAAFGKTFAKTGIWMRSFTATYWMHRILVILAIMVLGQELLGIRSVIA